jgi:DNA-binding NarL/FixJ family response regulator
MPDQARIRILGVDDHPLLREGIATISIASPTWRSFGSAAISTAGAEYDFIARLEFYNLFTKSLESIRA